MADTLSNILGAAQKVHDTAEKAFPTSQAPKHEYSNAPYSMAHKAKTPASGSLDKDISDVASGIKWRQEQGEALKP